MRNENGHNNEDTSAAFEKPTRSYGLLAGFAAFALAAGLTGGYLLNSSSETALAAESTTTTTVADAESSLEADSDADPFAIDEGADADSEPEAEQAETPAPEEDPEPEPEPDPDPAELAVDDVVDVGNTGEGSFTIHNIGDLPLTIESITGPAALSFSDAPVNLGGGESVEIDVTVDTSGLPFGDYEMEFDVKSSAGDESVTVVGGKFAIVVPLPPSPDVDVQDVVVVPHLAPIAPITIWNNEDYDVEVTLESLSARLTLPAEFTLVPGKNVIPGAITPIGLPAHITQNLDFEVSWWLGSEQATVVKFGT